MVNLFGFAALAASVTLVIAHPGEHHDRGHVKRELQTRDSLASRSAKSLAKCIGTSKAVALQERAIARRAATAARLRKERSLNKRKLKHRRDLASLQEFEKINHNMTGLVSGIDPGVLFGANTSCILTPENVIGLYYVLGEYIRSDVTEGQPGIPMHLEMQFIDTNTCEAVPGLMIDIWAANSTGVYSGIDSSMGQGGLNSTYMRGLQPTNADGVAEFDTIFPGHYAGRSTHEHIIAHVNASTPGNGTITGGTVAHIGQIFFEEALREAVEETYPYDTNTAEVVLNDDDMWAPTQADNSYDPFPEYLYLSDDIADGLLVWISIGIDTTANHDTNSTAAAYLAADGGHNNGNGTRPSGPPGGVPPGRPPPVDATVKARDYNLRKLYGGAARLAN